MSTPSRVRNVFSSPITRLIVEEISTEEAMAKNQLSKNIFGGEQSFPAHLQSPIESDTENKTKDEE